MRFLPFLVFCISIFGAEYDIAIIGTSPISLFEALYQHHLGKHVVILEQAAECGGSWKAIDVCGVAHADLGCHTIGAQKNIRDFLEEYAACSFVPMERPLQMGPFTGEYYFSKGCFELIENLETRIRAEQIDLRLNHRVDSVRIDDDRKELILAIGSDFLTASKIICTPASSFLLPDFSSAPMSELSYYHLYLLVADPEPPRFSYTSGGKGGASRIMNLTHFAGLTDTGMHLLVFQTHREETLQNGEGFIADLKKRSLLSGSAYILQSETRIYKQSHSIYARIAQLPPHHKSYFELLNTASFGSMTQYIAKWKEKIPSMQQKTK